MTDQKKNLLNFERQIYLNMKSKASKLMGQPSKLLLKYQKDLDKFSQRNFTRSSLTKLLDSINSSHIIYMGDFHTFDQSGRNLERILRHLQSNNKRISVGVEIVNIKDQEHINSYLCGVISELEFLESINYSHSWRFPWTHYKNLFHFAKKHKIEITALNSEGDLTQRDRQAANLIAKRYEEHPNYKQLILFGEMHILPDKLPKEVELNLDLDVSQLIIHQNLDEVYFKTRKRKAQFVKFSPFEYSIQTSPPWIKYESLIYWYENLADDPEFDLHEYIMETGLKTFTGGTQDNFILILKQINKIFKLNVTDGQLNNFNLYDHTSIDGLINKIDKIKNIRLQNFCKILLKKSKAFNIFSTNSYYCPSYSINRLATLSGIHLANLNLKKEQKENPLLQKDQSIKFCYLVYIHFYAYLATKLINPYKKTDLYIDLKKELKKKKLDKTREVILKAAISILDNEENIKTAIKGLKIKHLYSTSKIIGYHFAESTFEHIINTESEKLDLILQTLPRDNFSLNALKKLHKSLKRKGTFRKMKKRFF